MGNILFSDVVNLNAQTFIDFEALFAGSPLSAETIVLRLAVGSLGNLSDNVGIDNVRFGQIQTMADPVPLSAAIWFMGTGIAALRLTKHKKRSH